MCSKVVIIAIIVLISPNLIQSDSDPFCVALVPDAATQLQNGTVAIFQGKNLWFVTLDSKGQTTALTGPCLIKDIFPQMEGPIDAAVTIDKHDSITEFTGASIYFSSGNFFTFRNLRPYQVEWGDLVYLPVKGEQNKMGVTSDVAKKYMVRVLRHMKFELKSKLIND